MTTDIQPYCTTLKDLVGDDDPLAILSETPFRIKRVKEERGPAAR